MPKYIDNTNAGYLPHNRSEVAGHIQWFFSEGATSLAEARKKGFLDMGVFLGAEIKSEDKAIEVKKANEGKIFTAYKLGGEVTLGLELTTNEVADMRKARLLLLGADQPAFTQTALAAVATCTLGNFAAEPAKLNHAYQLLTAAGAPVRKVTTLVIDDLVEGVDYVLNRRLGIVRFINEATLPDAAPATLTVTAAAITPSDDDFMESVQAMQIPRRRGYSHFLVWDGTTDANLVMEFEPRPTEVGVTGGLKIEGENASEAKITVSFTSTDELVRVRA
ncbi:MAG: hypothetical protein LBC18_03305 [Opitutaceae bacterium]|jgi:hypothetical protein|nr:hypothetical protein [Opitutaceae bacterium]